MDRRRFLLTGGSVLALPLTGCVDAGSSGGSDDPFADDVDGASSPTVTVLEDEWYHEGPGEAGVRGEVENVSGERLPVVHVQARFFDRDDQFASARASTRALADRATWEFDVPYPGGDPSRVFEHDVRTAVERI